MVRWTSDTCDCILQWHNDINGNIVYDLHERKCVVHSGLTTQQIAIPHDDNKRKNIIDGLLRDNFTTLLTTTDANGSIVYKNGVTYNWSFSGNDTSRVLTVSITGVTLTTQQKATLQSLADTKFGANKVIVV